MGKDATEPRLVINDLRGGRNGTDPPLTLRDQECVEAINVDWWRASVCRKRSGASQLTPIGTFSGRISFLGRHVPSSDETLAELWAADDAATPVIARYRPTVAPGFVAPGIQDPVTGKGWDLQGISFRGKYFLAYDSGQARLHVYDPTTGTIRRAGLRTSTVTLTTANSGSGTYPAVLRYYRTRLVVFAGGFITRRGEPGPPTSFTPSGASAGVDLTFVAPPPSDGETHFDVEVSADGVTYYHLTTQPVNSTGYTDNLPVSAYGTLPLSEATGTYPVQKSYRFLAVDNNRLLGLGSFTPTDPQHRLEFSAVAGSLNIADEERVPFANYIDLDDADSGSPTGLIGPIFGSFYIFKYRQIWKLTPTGNAAQPYTIYPVSKIIGAIHQNAIDLGEDADGNPVVYFMSARGPYRLGLHGLEYIGLPVEDCIVGPTAILNLGSTTVPVHGVYNSPKRQMWWWYATGTSNDANARLVLDVRRSAWARHDGSGTRARCSAPFARVIAPVSKDLKPYIGQWEGSPLIYLCDDDTMTTDAGVPFQASVTTKPYLLGGAGAYCTMAQGTLIGPASDGVTLQQIITRDFGLETDLSTLQLSPANTETRVMRMFDAGGLSQCWAVQLTWRDAAPVASRWSIDLVTINYVKDQAVV